MTKRKNYANAKDVLPQDLLDKVQKHYSGLLWIPAPGRFYQERWDLVVALHLQGVSTVEISNLAGVTVRRVNQVLAEYRKGDEVRQIAAASGR